MRRGLGEFNPDAAQAGVRNTDVGDQTFALIPVLLIQQYQFLPDSDLSPECEQHAVSAGA